MADIYIYVLLCFFAPIGIFCLFWIFKKPFWSTVVYLPLLLYSVIQNVFLLGTYKGFWEEIKSFLHSEAILAVYLIWIPSIIGFLCMNIIYFMIQKIKAKKKNERQN